MEQIYTVRVKCRPDPGLNYPSERSYSSSTVGGLALAHLFLAALSFTLCALGYATHIWRGEYVGGIVLIVGALTAGLVGLLACKRWYVDRHIRWFLIVSVISCICAFVSAVLSCFILLQQERHETWRLVAEEEEEGVRLYEGVFNETDLAYNGTIRLFDQDTATLRRTNEEPVAEFRREIYVHIFLASIVEFVWSVLSVKIAWKGVKNSLKRKRNIKAGLAGGKRSQGVGQESRPDILENIRKSSLDPKFTNYSDVVKELCRLQRTSVVGDKLVSAFCTSTNELHHSDHAPLPLPESHLEYRQRIEKFLASNNEQCDSGIS